MKVALVLALVCAAAACAAARRPEAISSPSRVTRISTLDRPRVIRRPGMQVSALGAAPVKKPIDPNARPNPNVTDTRTQPKLIYAQAYYPVNVLISGEGVCSSNPSADWAIVTASSTQEVLGYQVADNMCSIPSPSTKGRARASRALTDPAIGGSAQTFGASWSPWSRLNTQAWQAFTIPPIPTANPDGSFTASVDALQLGVVLNVGAGTQANYFDMCQLKGVWFQVRADQGGAPSGAIAWDAYADFTTLVDVPTSATPIKYYFNSSMIVTFDVNNVNDTNWSPMVLPGSQSYPTKYWLYANLYTGDWDAKQCLAFWATTAINGKDVNQVGTWREATGGAGGYATTCTEDPTSTEDPGHSTWVAEQQVLYKCFNQGTASASSEPTATSRRCVAYRRQFNPVLECPAPLKSFIFNMFGFNGWAGAGQGWLGK